MAVEILQALGLRDRKSPEVVVCPTCGRTEIDLVSLARRIRRVVSPLNRPIRVAVMGSWAGSSSSRAMGTNGGTVSRRTLCFRAARMSLWYSAAARASRSASSPRPRSASTAPRSRTARHALALALSECTGVRTSPQYCSLGSSPCGRVRPSRIRRSSFSQRGRSDSTSPASRVCQ